MQRKSAAGTILFSAFTLGVVVIGILLSAQAGCSPRPATSAPAAKSAPQALLKIACTDELPAAVVERYGRRWAARNGARLEVVRQDPEAATAADVWVLPPARMPHFAAAGLLQPVPESYRGGGPYAWGGLLPLYRGRLLIWERQAYALPVLGDGRVCFYRADLFGAAEHRAAFRKKHGREPAPPATWEEFADLAEYFRDAHGGRPSLPPLPRADDNLDPQFFDVAAPFCRRAVRDEDVKQGEDVFSFHFELDTGVPWINKPGFVHALRLLQRLQGCRPADPAAEPAARFADGEAVLCVASPIWVKRFQDSPKVRGKFGICRVPGARHVFDLRSGGGQDVPDGDWMPYLGAGGWLGVVAKSSPQPELAFSLLAALGDPETSREIVAEPAWGGGVFRQEHLEITWESFGLGSEAKHGLAESLRAMVAHPQLINPVVRLRTPDERARQQELLAQVRAALTGKAEAQAALDATAARWREAVGKDLKKHIAEYRLSLGLLARP
jgi:multiple sugar transport system substrate-binding protein